MAAAQQHPELADPGLMRIAKTLKQVEAELAKVNGERGIGAGKSAAWHRAQADYYHDAISGRCSDFAAFGDETSFQALLNLRDLIRDEHNPIALAAKTAQIMTGLIYHCSVAHANAMERNGTLDDADAELAARSDVAHDRRVDVRLMGMR